MTLLKVLLAVLLCGLVTLQPCLGQSRVVGGSPVLNNRFPYFAELRIVFVDKGQQYVTYCGGALITSNVVLTVAHCINNPQIVWMSATFGRLSTAGDATFRSIKADSWTTHPNLNTTLKKNDIGVVRLSEKVAIAPIRLSFANGFPRQGLNVTVMGYGETDTERRRAKNLNQVQISVRNWDDCYRLYGEDDGPVKICAGGNGKNACLGDSGGPLIVRGQTRSGDIFAGIVSHGPTPCKDFPVVYTRVSAYKDWIRKEACVGTNLPSWCSG